MINALPMNTPNRNPALCTKVSTMHLPIKPMHWVCFDIFLSLNPLAKVCFTFRVAHEKLTKLDRR